MEGRLSLQRSLRCVAANLVVSLPLAVSEALMTWGLDVVAFSLPLDLSSSLLPNFQKSRFRGLEVSADSGG